MSSTWGKNIKLSIFGESHGQAIGVVIDSLPSGIKLDFDLINKNMKRRAPGNSPWSTPRKEKDEVKIISGLYNGYTTGTPLCAMIENTNQNSKSYEHLKAKPRPSHADYTGHIRYSGYEDTRGGGHFSGRLCAPLVFAGSIAQQILMSKGINIIGRIFSIGDILDDKIDMTNPEINICDINFPVINCEKKDLMIENILKAGNNKNSLGGVIEVIVSNMPCGIGSPIFDALESNIASLLFSVPAVKGIEFGAGFGITKMTGVQANDSFTIVDDKIKTRTNNNGGILGGISNSMPIILRCAVKPTPSISTKQTTVDISKMEEVDISIGGRHDPCIIPRAVVIVESCAALGILDTWMSQNNWS